MLNRNPKTLADHKYKISVKNTPRAQNKSIAKQNNLKGPISGFTSDGYLSPYDPNRMSLDVASPRSGLERAREQQIKNRTNQKYSVRGGD